MTEPILKTPLFLKKNAAPRTKVQDVLLRLGKEIGPDFYIVSAMRLQDELVIEAVLEKDTEVVLEVKLPWAD